MHVTKREYVRDIFHVFNLCDKSRHPKMIITETAVIMGLSITKILNAVSKIVYMIDSATVLPMLVLLELLKV